MSSPNIPYDWGRISPDAPDWGRTGQHRLGCVFKGPVHEYHSCACHISRGKIHLYKARDGWRWRAVARNGRIVAESGEAYRGRLSCAAAGSDFGPPGMPVVYSKTYRRLPK